MHITWWKSHRHEGLSCGLRIPYARAGRLGRCKLLGILSRNLSLRYRLHSTKTNANAVACAAAPARIRYMFVYVWALFDRTQEGAVGALVGAGCGRVELYRLERRR